MTAAKVAQRTPGGTVFFPPDDPRKLLADYLALRNAHDDLVAALRGMLAIEDSVTQGQERELRNEWLPKARAALVKAEGQS